MVRSKKLHFNKRKEFRKNGLYIEIRVLKEIQRKINDLRKTNIKERFRYKTVLKIIGKLNFFNKNLLHV